MKKFYMGFFRLLSVFSLYGYAYLYYTGPDTMIYTIANVILFLGCLIYRGSSGTARGLHSETVLKNQRNKTGKNRKLV